MSRAIEHKCLLTTDKYVPQRKDWGVSFLIPTEIEALRIAYIYRRSPGGVTIENVASSNSYQVTIFNEKAKAMGCDV